MFNKVFSQNSVRRCIAISVHIKYDLFGLLRSKVMVAVRPNPGSDRPGGLQLVANTFGVDREYLKATAPSN